MHEKYNAQQAAPGWQSAAVLGRSMAAECCDEPQRAQREPAMAEAINRMRRAIEDAEQKLESLYARLDPILGVPTPENGSIAKDLSGTSPLVREVAGMAARVDAVAYGMLNLYSRIEL